MRGPREGLPSQAGCCCPLPCPSLFDLQLSSSLLASHRQLPRQSKQQSRDNLTAHNSLRHLLPVSRLTQGKPGIDKVLNGKISPKGPQTRWAMLLPTPSSGSRGLCGLCGLDLSLYKAHLQVKLPFFPVLWHTDGPLISPQNLWTCYRGQREKAVWRMSLGWLGSHL